MRKFKLQTEVQKAKQAKSVLIVGGGIVGVEVAAELADGMQERNQRIGIVSRPRVLLPDMPPRAQNLALVHLNNKGIELYLGVTYNDEFKRENNFEHVIMCTGFKVNTSFMRDEFKECIDEESGKIQVNKKMQVINKNPVY